MIFQRKNGNMLNERKQSLIRLGAIIGVSGFPEIVFSLVLLSSTSRFFGLFRVYVAPLFSIRSFSDHARFSKSHFCVFKFFKSNS